MKIKNLLLLIVCLAGFFLKAQTHTRKTRSDKGKTHSHTTKYLVKKALTPKPTAKKKK
jgi:hypothetical protein